MSEFNLFLTTLNEIQNHEDFEIIWLDTFNNIPNELRKSFNNYLKVYHSFESCNDYIITNVQSTRKILLILTNFCDTLSYFNDLPQIHSIYILKKNFENIEYVRKNDKLVNIFTDIYTLVERLRQDILLTYRYDFPIDKSCLHEMKIELSLINFNQTTLMFLWNQLFLFTLVNPSSINLDTLKSDMIKQCRLECQNDVNRLKRIDQFALNCTPENILYWYTENSPVYQLVNRAFRTRSIDLICKFRYFTILLHQKLKDLRVKQQGWKFGTLYRAQKIKKNDLENLKSNIGSLISTNTIMSTTRNLSVADTFLTPNENVEANEFSTLFEINVENGTKSICYSFADISEFSQFPDEEEVLFFAGAVFRVDSVTCNEKSIWIIKLTLNNQLGEQLQQIMSLLNFVPAFATIFSEITKKTDDYNLINRYHRLLTNRNIVFSDILILLKHIHSVIYLLMNPGNYQIAIDIYKKFLSSKDFTDTPEFIIFHIIIANNYVRLSQYDDAFLYYGIALSLLDEQNRLTGELYDCLGDAWNKINNHSSALACYKEGLKIITSHYEKDKSIPQISRKIVNIYREQDDHENARIYENQAYILEEYQVQQFELLDVEMLARHHQNQSLIKLDYPTVQTAHRLYGDGLHLIRKCSFSQGLEKLLMAESLYKQNLSLYDSVMRKFAKLYDNAAFAYFCLNDHFKALITWKKAVDIRTNLYSS
jgi:tetratricopeptide (TPR) repeat protein